MPWNLNPPKSLSFTFLFILILLTIKLKQAPAVQGRAKVKKTVIEKDVPFFDKAHKKVKIHILYITHSTSNCSVVLT